MTMVKLYYCMLEILKKLKMKSTELSKRNYIDYLSGERTK